SAVGFFRTDSHRFDTRYKSTAFGYSFFDSHSLMSCNTQFGNKECIGVKTSFCKVQYEDLKNDILTT
ncbi:MAG TPA: hypothetical protein VF141_16650, partial [Chryseolinea sp.]